VASSGGSKSEGGTTRKSTGKATGSTNGSAGTRRRAASARTSSASAAGATARARISSTRAKSRTTRASRAKTDDIPIVEPTPTVPADDEVMAASNAVRALNPDMPRVAWLRTQLNQMEARQRDRLLKFAQLTLIAIVFITFVLQNATPVNVHFLLFSVNIRLIWVIFGTGLLGVAAGYLIGRPDKSLRALLPKKEKRPVRSRTAKI
jgi:uncharacterized integral membrane protein